jgi:hypothetical protein
MAGKIDDKLASAIRRIPTEPPQQATPHAPHQPKKPGNILGYQVFQKLNN